MDQAKRIFDFTFALTGLFFSMPLWFLFSLAIWLEDGSPIFYQQERSGRRGKLFKGIKFRSMVKGAERESGPVQAKENDSRITRVGTILRATAMDELPQLLNIISGAMSFVGPRALRPVEIDSEDGQPRKICEFAGFKERSSVSPGLTGITQILFPRDITRSKKFQYDIWYINNRNFLLDLKIIIFSFLITFMGKWETRGERFGYLTQKFKLPLGGL